MEIIVNLLFIYFGVGFITSFIYLFVFFRGVRHVTYWRLQIDIDTFAKSVKSIEDTKSLYVSLQQWNGFDSHDSIIMRFFLNFLCFLLASFIPFLVVLTMIMEAKRINRIKEEYDIDKVNEFFDCVTDKNYTEEQLKEMAIKARLVK